MLTYLSRQKANVITPLRKSCICKQELCMQLWLVIQYLKHTAWVLHGTMSAYALHAEIQLLQYVYLSYINNNSVAKLWWLKHAGSVGCHMLATLVH